ncbi:unnamed protein product [Chondrus crispus]|uniref:Uncharacterized protein n=1 Tax=Chondrus crispus TaxID=2769 RepID=S0F3J3_CHOCR|nr:unnamed protein product [Chondrus crispus]CDF77449.1 unnamed protein product [Chondrus crispus]|eukprot:XP_005712323.1 unnamed protein product [Chondrus crispus]
MEGTVSDMQQELRTRDKIVEEVSLETDLLASLLAARDAELHETQRKLESAMGSEDAGGGDADESELSLEEIKSTVSAEQLTLRAEIAQAELAKSDLGADDLDPLDRVEREMGAKRELLQARLTRAQASAKRAEYEKRRKQGAVDDVLRSGDREQAADTLGVARQKQVIADAEAKPRARRRGRPRKKAAGGDDGADGGKGGPAAKK